jgi:hypothetical protein
MVAIRQLGCSLHEIYPALHPDNQRNGGVPPLFAVSRGSVFDERPLLAFLVKIYYFVLRLVFGGPTPPPTDEALRFILNTFFNEAVDVVYEGRQRRITHYVRSLAQPTPAQTGRYADFLRKELHGSVREAFTPLYLQTFNHTVQPVDEMALIRTTHISAAFRQYISAFWEECVRGDEPSRRFVDSIRPYLGDQNQLTLCDKPLFDALAREHAWGQLEGVMNRRIPVDLLAKLHDPETLTVDERVTLENWVGRLNEQRREISAVLLTTVLDELVNMITIAGSHPTTFEDIIYWLHQQGCEALDPNAPDLSYMRATTTLHQAGLTLSYSGQNYTLGQEIARNDEQSETLVAFEIQEQPNLEIKFPVNRFVYPISLKQREMDAEGSLFPFPRIIAFDRNRGFLIQERLTNTFTDHVWTSDSEVLDHRDLSHAFGFAAMIACLHDWNETFEDFSLSDIKLTAQGDWRMSRRLVRSEGCYHRLEEYCIQAAAGNPFVLRYLMEASRLHQDPCALYYQHIIRGTFVGEITRRNFPLTAQREIDVQYSQGLYEQAERLKTRAIARIEGILRGNQNFPAERLNDIPAMVSQRLMEMYNESPTPGHLEEDLLERVIDSFREPSQGSSQKKKFLRDDPAPLMGYYESEYRRILDRLRGSAADQSGPSSSSSFSLTEV